MQEREFFERVKLCTQMNLGVLKDHIPKYR